MPLFQIVSKIDGKTYDVDWDTNNPVLQVNQPVEASVSATGWGGPPPMPSNYGLCPNLDVGLVRAFEQGRLSRDGEENPYAPKGSRSDLSTAWAFGVLCK